MSNAASQVLKGQSTLHLTPKDGILGLIQSIAEKQESPESFYVLDLGVVERLMSQWNSLLPNVKPFFAVKCNPNPSLLLALSSLGANFDCASCGEIMAVQSLGVSSDRILYANACKSLSYIKYAASVRVNLTTFDSKCEIDKLKKWHPKCELLLRIKVDNKTSWREFGSKFGALDNEIMALLCYAHENGFKVVGVSFHVGTKQSDPKAYYETIARAKAIFNMASELKLPAMQILDIGGGFQACPLFEDIAAEINRGVEAYFCEEKNLSVIAEPGRYFAENAFTLVTNVIGKRVRGSTMEYWIDDGIYGSFNLPAFDRSSMLAKPLFMKDDDGDRSGGSTFQSTVFGPTCDSLDFVLNECELPEMEVGDLLVFQNMGAYTSSAATKFNGFNMQGFPTYVTYQNPN
ncbi:Orn/DAP/Arg decarboxylase 2, N-terminal [Dillenia turbinata]|uniref:ornithine decarboxylase n=1 Tax=Dillenia turbinata TaxID=194707 RepID=A0AAN8VX03_9MAGN